MIAFNWYGHRIVAERDSLNTYKKKAEKGDIVVICQHFAKNWRGEKSAVKVT